MNRSHPKESQVTDIPKEANVVVMFPYPSGKGLHMGHYYNYSVIDSYCRYLRHRGSKVSQPFGYDSFGLPAENYARETGGDPREITYANIDSFRAQMEHMNTQYEERLVTSDNSYCKWTRWLFLKLLEHRLAYKDYGLVNWCPSCETVLANEQVKRDCCDRCETAVIQKSMNQWYFRITAYRDRLISGLDSIDYPSGTIKRQRHWLESLRDWCVSRQRKWGCPIPVEGETDTLDTFVDSSFYYLRYLTDSDDEFLPQEVYRPVDLYVGGSEHATMHLIYARFIHMFLYDIGVVPQEEPFNRVIHQGMITMSGSKMSKSKGNVVDPTMYNSSELRMALMFIGPYAEGGEWNDRSIKGIQRFLSRFDLWMNNASSGGADLNLSRFFDQIERNVLAFKFHLVVSEFMKLLNSNKQTCVSLKTRDSLISLLECFCPRI